MESVMSNPMNAAQSSESQPIVCHMVFDAPGTDRFEDESYRVARAEARSR